MKSYNYLIINELQFLNPLAERHCPKGAFREDFSFFYQDFVPKGTEYKFLVF
jgi:hypothetical protein